ncbi:DUF4347 domain-containing protein [Candidatus Methylospira mobilis]|nr:DUF4347 domain-containing protein [Candidatus Methylospira mobilis]
MYTFSSAKKNQIERLTSGTNANGTDPAHVVFALTKTQAADPARDADKKEVVFIDTSVADYQTLVNGIRAGMEIVLLNAQQSGLSQMAQWAVNHNEYDALHVLSHGAKGELRLGTDAISDVVLAAPETKTELAEIGSALKADGDLLLYGCEIGAGNDGIRFLNNLASATGANVAGSTGLTGSAALGGRWALERRVGLVDTKTLDISGYTGVLSFNSSPTGSFVIQGLGNTYSFQQAVGMPSANVGVLLKQGSTDWVRSYTSSGVLNYAVDVNTLSGVSMPSANWSDILALSNGDLVVSYGKSDSGAAGSNNAYFVVLNSSGTEIVGPTQINSLTGSSLTRFMSMAELSNGNIVFAYQRPDNNSMAVRVFDPNGVAVTNEILVSNNPSGSQLSVAASTSGGFMVEYQYSAINPGGASYTQKLNYNIYDNAGVQQGSTTTVWSNTGTVTFYGNVLALANGNYLYETSVNSTVSGNIYSSSGILVSSSVSVDGKMGNGSIAAMYTTGDQGYITGNYSNTYLNAVNSYQNFSNVDASLVATVHNNTGTVAGTPQIDTATASAVWNATSSYYSLDTAPSYYLYSGYSSSGGVVEVKVTPDSTGTAWTIGANLFETASSTASSPAVTGTHTNAGTAASYTLGSAAAVLDSGITVSTAADGGSWNMKSLTVQISANSAATDSLSLPAGAGVNPGGSTTIWIDTNNSNALMYGSTLIGTTSDGATNAASVSGNGIWTFTFNSSATDAGVQALADAIKFSDSIAGAGTSQRTVTYIFTDSVGSATVNDLVTVSASVPTASGTHTTAGTAAAYTLGGAAAVLDSGITVSTAADGGSWNTKSLTVQISANSAATDSLSLPAGAGVNPGGSTTIWIDTNNSNALMYGSTLIGTTSDGATNAASVSGNGIWTFTFNSSATDAGVQALADAIKFSDSIAGAGTSQRTVTYIFTDSVGSATVNDLVTVSASVPTASGTHTTAGTAAAYTLGGAAAVLDSGITVSTAADGGSWNTKSLTVQISANSAATDSLSLPAGAGVNPGGSTTIWIDTNNSNALMYGSTLIGTTSDGATNAASVSGNGIWTFTFNSSATDAGVQALADAIKFGDASPSAAASQRTVTYTFTDSKGSATINDLVTVSTSDIIVNYNFTATNWVANNGTTYPADGGAVSGTMTFDWTTHTVLAANILSTGSSDGTSSTVTFTQIQLSSVARNYTYSGATYTYNGTTYSSGMTYAEVSGTSNGQTIFLDFTQGNTTDIFPGQLGSVHTSENSDSRVLSSTVNVSPASAPTSTPTPTPTPTSDVITADPVQQTDTAAYINSQINSAAASITVAPPVATLSDYQAVVAAAAVAGTASGKTINVVLPSAQVVALPQNTLQDSANAGYTGALQRANDVVIATATAPSLSSFTSTVNSISGYAPGSTVVLPQLASVAVAPTDLDNSAFVAALQNSGDTTLTLDLSNSASNIGGAAATSSTYSVLPGFTQIFSGGAKGNNYMVGATSNLGVANPTVTADATASTSQTLTVQSLTAAATAAATAITGPSSGFQQIYTIQIQGYSSDYTLSGYYGTATLTSKSSGQVITVNIPQPVAGANNSGIDLQFLDGSLSLTGNTDGNGIWTAWITQGVAKGGDLSGWYNNNSQLIPATGSAQALDLGSASVQSNLLNSADNSQSAGFNGGVSLGLLPSTVTTINSSTANAILTGILGAGSNNPATFISGDSITLTGGNTTLNLFDFAGGAALPANTTVSGVNTLNLASNARIGSAANADNFSSWNGLTTLNATASGAGANANDNGLINVIVGNDTAVNLTANDAYATTNGLSSPIVGAITVGGGGKITIAQKLSTADGSAISSGGITVNGGSATTSVTVTQAAAVSGKVTDGAVILNDISANSTTLTGSLATVVLTNYGQGSVINDNAIRFLTLSGTGGTLTINDSNTSSSTINGSATVPISTLYLTLTGLSAAGDNTITDLNAEITTLSIITAGTVNSTLNGFVDNHLTSISVQGTSALTLLNPSASLTSYSVTGSTAALTVAGHSDAAASKLTLSGAVTYTGSADAVSTGIVLIAGTDNSNISFTTTGALSGNNINTFMLGNGNNTLSDIVTAQSGSINGTTNISVGSGSNQISTGSNTVNIALGKHATGVIDSFNIGASAGGSLSIITAITGAQAGDTISIADATQFVGAGVTAANLTASGGSAATATLDAWVNAALSAQGANLQSHAISWFNFGGNTYLIEQAGSQGAAFAAGDTLLKLVGTLNESAAVLNGHAVTL